MVTMREQIAYRGFNNLPEIKKPSRELLAIASLIDSLDVKDNNLDKIKLKRVLETSKDFLNNYFTLSMVPFEKVINIPLLGEATIYGKIDPLKLPIKLVANTDLLYGCSHEVIYPSSTTFLRYCWIELPKCSTEMSMIAYIHEIVHTQLNHRRGLIKDYVNIEFLSIFLELVAAFEINNDEKLLNIHDDIRLKELRDIILELEKYFDTKDEEIEDILLEGTSYLHSTLKAYHLFFKYYYGDISERKRIMLMIQKVFNQELTVERLQMYLGINYDNSENVLAFKKYLRRGKY